MVYIVILLLLSLVGYVWLLIQAFKVSKGWGFGVMFLSPVAALVFAVKNWDSAKKPFAVYMLSLCFSVGFGVYTVMSSEAVKATIELSKEVEQGVISQKEASRLIGDKMANQTFEMLEKFAETETDKASLALFRRYFDVQAGKLSAAETASLQKDTEMHLERPDLKPDQRQELTKMLNALKTKEAVAAKIPAPSAPEPSQNEASSVEISTGTAVASEAREQGEVIPEAIPVAVPSAENGPPVPGAIKIEEPQTGLPDFSPAEESWRPGGFSESLNAAPSPYREIRFAEAKAHVGSQVIFTNKNGGEERCFLIGASAEAFQCEKRMDAGTFSTTYKKSEVKALKLVKP